ncbi:MAG TPA: hypothetical protein VHO27_04620 [Angustibacter sp.]|nr:hypothetical protein [Angustibacter sp.]
MEPSHEALCRVAARNNAEWCAAMCRSHGVVNGFDGPVWSASQRTPTYYPDAVTLAPTAGASDVLGRIDLAAPGASVKDSFADLDLAPAGFEVLFDAWWIHRPPRPSDGTGLAGWEVLEDADGLRDLADAWDAGEGNADLFRPRLLDEPDVRVLARRSGGRVVAGAVANRTDDVVGLSNLFTVDDHTDAAWTGALDLVQRLYPTHAVVGYERGEDLTVALRHGLRPVGRLRVWIVPDDA